jgi:hypothetical protein
MRSGQVVGTGEFGRLVDKDGNPLLDAGLPYISNDPGTYTKFTPCRFAQFRVFKDNHIVR